jgi:hypothetical protein
VVESFADRPNGHKLKFPFLNAKTANSIPSIRLLAQCERVFIPQALGLHPEPTKYPILPPIIFATALLGPRLTDADFDGNCAARS